MLLAALRQGLPQEDLHQPKARGRCFETFTVTHLKSSQVASTTALRLQVNLVNPELRFRNPSGSFHLAKSLSQARGESSAVLVGSRDGVTAEASLGSSLGQGARDSETKTAWQHSRSYVTPGPGLGQNSKCIAICFACRLQEAPAALVPAPPWPTRLLRGREGRHARGVVSFESLRGISVSDNFRPGRPGSIKSRLVYRKIKMGPDGFPLGVLGALRRDLKSNRAGPSWNPGSVEDWSH